tara:strand:- start:291 stop:671 length:381 start_codon:yes stop_codon:yes gene_type:complete
LAKLNASTYKTRDDAERHFLQIVDKEAESVRMRHLTAGSGQSLVYEIKYQEALIGSGPYIEAEAEALEVPLQEVIDSIIAARHLTNQQISLLEGKRLKTKKLIKQATNATEMHAIVKNANLTLDTD